MDSSSPWLKGVTPLVRPLTLTLVIALLCSPISTLPALAHEGPEHEIEELTEEIKKLGESPGLLVERAIEYRVLGKYTEASRDLERAARLDPNSTHAYREWSQVLFLSGKVQEAIDTLSRALLVPHLEPAEKAGLLASRAEWLKSKKDYPKALVDCDQAILLYAENPDWNLLRSDLHRRLKLSKERISGVEQGIRLTGAATLHIERVEAWIDDRQFDLALKTIESELASSRLQSSWLIRRAQARLGLGQKPEAHQDLRTALAEIATRLNLSHPDVPLVLDNAVAHELLDELTEARRYYELALEHSADDDLRDKLKSLKPR